MFFGEQIRHADDDIPTSKRGPQNLLDLLPETFTIEEAKRIRQQHGMDTEHTSTMVRTWKSRGYMCQISDISFKQQTDASFCQFESLEYGWRAAFYLLTRTYYHKYRLFTIRAIISKWAPPQENLTATYIQNVCRLTGIPPDEPIGIPSDQPARWMAVGIAMAIQENGIESLDYFAMLRGWGLAREGTSTLQP